MSANLCMPHVPIHGSAQCAVEKAPTGSQLLTMLFFFLIKNETNLQFNLGVEFGSEKCAEKMGNLDLEQFNKSRNGQF